MDIKTLFFISLLGVSYSYFIYPIILLCLKKSGFITIRNQSTTKTAEFPRISFIITAYNEESRIKQKIENTLELDYPKAKLEILVASDASSDKTNLIVNNYQKQAVKLIDVKERKGKEHAQLKAIQASHGDILVFSDVATRINTDALLIIANSFRDERVGAVSSEDRFITTDGKIVGEGVYVKYEMWLRKLECSFNTLVGLSGSFFAARKQVCQSWNIQVPSDFNIALNCVRKDYIAISHPELLGYYPNIKDEAQEYQRKVRTVIRGIAALFSQKEVMNPFKYGLFSFQVISHKLMRWLVPWFLLITLLSNLLLWNQHWLFSLTLIAQVIFYLLSIIGSLFSAAKQNALIKISFFFVQVNLAITQAMLMFLYGKRITRWESSKR